VSWKLLNIAGFALWILVIPVAYFWGWVYSVAFVSVASIYANAISHLAGWRADEPNEDMEEILRWLDLMDESMQELRLQLDKIERRL
jgi:hypothetical protein